MRRKLNLFASLELGSLGVNIYQMDANGETQVAFLDVKRMVMLIFLKEESNCVLF